MKCIEREGKSASQIIENFIKEFNLTLNDFKFEVVEEGSSSFLNLFGSKPAKVKFFLQDTSENLRKFAHDLITRLDISYNEINITNNDREYHLNISGIKDPGFIIGKDAKILDSIQYILNQIINKHEKKQLYLKIDVDGYREKKKAILLKKVETAAEKVKMKGKSITLEPLHAANRRIVHQFIEKDGKLRTMTIGEGDFKRVVIMPSEKLKSTAANPGRNPRHRPGHRPKTKPQPGT
ncbi:MAG: Jag N-terminal domain-containing protein [Candidatus Cloacimonetes bacterium]|nr:Jag N-terminal domain-containing protein [Candidatus Cloacimonadota bacterium]